MPMFSAQVIEDALRQFSERELSITDSEGEYVRGYPALVELAGRVMPGDENSVISLAYAAYGWMPTILKKLPDKDQVKALGELVKDLRKIDSGALSLLKEKRNILKAINGSVVGVSKFLHFCAPQKIPIWDSRIGKIFDCHNWNLVNNIDNFLAYVKAMDEHQKNENFVVLDKLLAEFKKAGIDFSRISPLRKLELCLFLEGKFR